jgi:hypothetical protein
VARAARATAAITVAVPKAAPAPVLPALAADQIVARSVVARGGAPAWSRVQSMTLSGKLDAGRQRHDGGMIAASAPLSRVEARARVRQIALQQSKEPAKPIELPFTLELARPNQSRLEIPFQGQTAVQVFDGSNGWKLRPFLGRSAPEPFSADEQRAAADQQQLDGPLVNHVAKGTKVALDGTDRVDGRDAYRLKLTLKNGDVRRLWVDAKTFLDVKIEGAPRRMDGRMRRVETSLRDWKPVQGVMVPYLYETTVEAVAGSERIVVEKVALDAALTPSRFVRPL